MAGFCKCVRQIAATAAFAVATAFALVPSADAQLLPPFGAAPPGEIVQRLRAEGYILIGPLRRRETVYLADVTGGPAGRERLVIDAWSGEILQRFAVRQRGFVPEGGEFSEPPPLGPPPPRDFREGNKGYGGGPGGYEPPQKPRARPRPAATARKGGEEPKQAAPAAQQPPEQSPGTGSPGATPTAGAPAAGASSPVDSAGPNPSEPAKAEPSPANDSAKPPTEAQPKPDAAASPPAATQPQAKEPAPPTAAAPANPAPAEKRGERKVNDVPVNPLD